MRIDYSDKSVPASRRIFSAKKSIDYHKGQLKKFREIIRDLALEQIEEVTGLKSNSIVPIKLHGEVYQAKVIYFEYRKHAKLVVRIDTDRGEKMIRIIPQQIIGLESLDQEEIERVFSFYHKSIKDVQREI